jgi:hypothetical protein
MAGAGADLVFQSRHQRLPCQQSRRRHLFTTPRLRCVQEEQLQREAEKARKEAEDARRTVVVPTTPGPGAPANETAPFFTVRPHRRLSYPYALHRVLVCTSGCVPAIEKACDKRSEGGDGRAVGDPFVKHSRRSPRCSTSRAWG